MNLTRMQQRNNDSPTMILHCEIEWNNFKVFQINWKASALSFAFYNQLFVMYCSTSTIMMFMTVATWCIHMGMSTDAIKSFCRPLKWLCAKNGTYVAMRLPFSHGYRVTNGIDTHNSIYSLTNEYYTFYVDNLNSMQMSQSAVKYHKLSQILSFWFIIGKQLQILTESDNIWMWALYQTLVSFVFLAIFITDLILTVHSYPFLNGWWNG